MFNLIHITLIFPMIMSVFAFPSGLLRCGKSCRLRWTNYLRPDIKRGPFTPEEEKLVIQLHAILGNRYLFHFSLEVLATFHFTMIGLIPLSYDYQTHLIICDLKLSQWFVVGD